MKVTSLFLLPMMKMKTVQLCPFLVTWPGGELMSGLDVHISCEPDPKVV